MAKSLPLLYSFFVSRLPVKSGKIWAIHRSIPTNASLTIFAYNDNVQLIAYNGHSCFKMVIIALASTRRYFRVFNDVSTSSIRRIMRKSEKPYPFFLL